MDRAVGENGPSCLQSKAEVARHRDVKGQDGIALRGILGSRPWKPISVWREDPLVQTSYSTKRMRYAGQN